MFDLIILNYKNYNDTIQLIRSILETNDLDLIHNVFIIDNDSKNNSLDKIIKHFSFNCFNVKHKCNSYVAYYKSTTYLDIDIHFIQSTRNLGYAGGNNIGLKEFIHCQSDYAIVLNNDVYFPPNQLTILLKDAICHFSKNKKIGLIGSTLYYYDKPHLIQASGGTLNKVICKTSHLNALNQKVTDTTEPDYPIGALLIFSKEVLENVGFLSEEYFLYYEELDYIHRMVKLDYSFCILSNAKVLHKEGGAAGSDSIEYKNVSLISDYYLNINKLVFTRKFYPQYKFTVTLVLILNLFRRFIRGEFRKSKNILFYLLNGNSK